MKSATSLNISKSSLISLKAELLRKKEEVKSLKEGEENKFIHCVPKVEKKTIHTKSNKGVQERNEKDIQENEEDQDLLEKSRKVLEAKSRLYDKLQQKTYTTDNQSQYLVDFKQKPAEDDKPQDNLDDELIDVPSDPEEDWVDFVDVLGRTRRCLRRDLPLMKSKDSELQKTLEPKLVESTKPVESSNLELFSADMHRAALRQKWEEQELKLREKADIHYQDLLFDEARSHGVGYFNFSEEEAERLRQQDSLKSMRQETAQKQSEIKAVWEKRQQQMTARIQAARRRRRERMGLPPEEEDEPEPEVEATSVQPPIVEDKVEDLEEALKRAAHVRPWDIGKDGVKTPEVMTQEEWVEKKREERPDEFAPPSYPEPSNGPVMLHKRNKQTLFFTSKKSKPVSENTECSVTNNETSEPEVTLPCRPGAEIAPPATMEYYRGTTGALPERLPPANQNIADSISAGLQFLRKQVEDKEKKQKKDFFGIM